MSGSKPKKQPMATSSTLNLNEALFDPIMRPSQAIKNSEAINLNVEEFSEAGGDVEATARLQTIPPALRSLAFTRHIFMRITEHFDNALFNGKRNYEFFNTFGARIFLATVMEPSLYCFVRPFETYIWSHDGHAAFKMEGTMGRLGRCAGASISLPDEFLLGSIQQDHRNCHLEYFVLDNKQPRTFIFKIKGPRLDWIVMGGLGSYNDFQIYSANDKYIGKVSQHWDRLGENFVKDDNNSFRSYGASLPIGMSPNLKAILMAVLILLDLQFFPTLEERSKIFHKHNRNYIAQSLIISSFIIATTVAVCFVIAMDIKLVIF